MYISVLSLVLRHCLGAVSVSIRYVWS